MSSRLSKLPPAAPTPEDVAIKEMEKRVVLAELKARLAEARYKELKANTDSSTLRAKQIKAAE